MIRHIARLFCREVARPLPLLCLAEALERRLALATFTVLNTNDSGAGSFRQAIIDADASAAADTINFDSSGVFSTPQTISLLSALPQIMAAGGPLSIVGSGASRLTVRRDPSAGSTFRIFHSTTLTLNISGLTASGGNPVSDGGALLVSGAGMNVTLDSVVFSGNSSFAEGGAINIDGASFLTLRNSTISGNSAGEDGGGVYFFNGGSLFMENSTISGNTSSTTAAGGGGLYFFGTVSASPPPGFIPGTLVIRNSTINNNTATANGGGILLPNFSGNLLLQNSTISGNTAGLSGGGAAITGNSGSMTLQNSTITGNTSNTTSAGTGGGGLARTSATAGTLTISNSIVSGNFNTNGRDILASPSTTTNVNFSAVGSSVGFTSSPSSANNLPFGADLLLGSLANNGGPTRTHALSAASPAINTASNSLVPSGFTHDQRGSGFARISGQSADIGAFERDIVAPIVYSSEFLFLTAPQTLRYAFSENVSDSLAISDLVLKNLTSGSTVPAAKIALAYDSSTNTATFTFPGFPFAALPDGNYRATLSASGVSDPSGNPLPADHVNFFFFQQGDANHDGQVNLVDFNTVAQNFGSNSVNFSQGDFSYDAQVNLVDVNILAGRFGSSLFAIPMNRITANLAPPARFGNQSIIHAIDEDLGDLLSLPAGS